MSRLSFAFCTYNRARGLDALVAAMRNQHCSVPFEILAVNNNSTDDTEAVLQRLAAQPGPPLRHVTERSQGITYARNRALEEARGSEYLVFIDDDEIPLPGLLAAAVDGFERDGADCVGGRVRVALAPEARPAWLTADLLGFLAEVDHGAEPFWITSERTPVWTANIAYRMRLFTEDPGLRFDRRYDRQGKDIGGGEDVVMLRSLLARGARIRYRPDMVVDHHVESWRLRRGYFLRLHYRSGLRTGALELPDYDRTIGGIPPFLIVQAARHLLRSLVMFGTHRPGALRQAMNFTNAIGMINGYRSRNAA